MKKSGAEAELRFIGVAHRHGWKLFEVWINRELKLKGSAMPEVAEMIARSLAGSDSLSITPIDSNSQE